MICTDRINPACGIPRFLSRFARRTGLVHLRQTFVLRCHGDNGWPLRAEASFTRRFPLIVETLARLRSRSCIIDGEAVACDDNGVASFDLIRHHRHNDRAFLYAFDLIELNGDDLRRDPLEVRKATLRSMLAKAGLGLRFNEHIEDDGPTIFAHACKMGLEGIVSKRKDSLYRSGRSPDWLKMKNSDAPAVKREAEEDWRHRR